MTADMRLHGAKTAMHDCVLHDYDNTKLCSGRLKKGGRCNNKATDTSESGMMPTCGIHRDQLKVSGWCRVRLPCGFECGRLFEWKPYGFEVCLAHRKDVTVCFFLGMPKEMRLCVYEYLLPDRSIPARYGNSRSLRSDGERAYTAILRVNKLIHDEATDILYRGRAFAIELSITGLRMCNSVHPFTWFGPSICNPSARQDYFHPLRLPDPQYEQRLMMIARQEQANVSGEFHSARTPTIRDNQSEHETIETLWKPPLSDRCFNMIRAFLIQLILPSVRMENIVSRSHGPPNWDAEFRKALESKLYEYCDQLHTVVRRLQLKQRPIAHLAITMSFDIEREDAFSAAQLLLRPFRRLCNIGKSELLSITIKNFNSHETQVLNPDWISCAPNRAFADYLKCWSKDLASSQPAFSCPQVFDAYWKLEKLVSHIRQHCRPVELRFVQFADLLHAARIAREAEDLERFKEIWDQVVNIWFGYVKEQKYFESNVTVSINAVNDIIKRGSQTSGKRSSESV